MLDGASFPTMYLETLFSTIDRSKLTLPVSQHFASYIFICCCYLSALLLARVVLWYLLLPKYLSKGRDAAYNFLHSNGLAHAQPTSIYHHTARQKARKFQFQNRKKMTPPLSKSTQNQKDEAKVHLSFTP